MQKIKYAFTLVELIVVITILAILGTIAFISLQGYSKDSRNSVRISDMSGIKTTLDLFKLEAGKYPITTDGVEILYSGVEAWTQGFFGETTFSNVNKLDKVPTDPLTDSKYVYSVTNTKQEYEIAGITEEDGIGFNNILFNQTTAGDKIAKLKITGNYNGKFLKVSTGGIDYILNVPSIITSTGGTLDYIINNNGLAYDGYNNLPVQFDGSQYKSMGETPEITLINPLYIIAYTGTLADLSSEDQVGIDARTTLLTNAINAYNGTTIVNEGGIAEVLAVDTGNPAEVDYLSRIIVNTDLNGTINIVAKTPSSGGGGITRFVSSADKTTVLDNDTGLTWQSHRDINGDLPSLYDSVTADMFGCTPGPDYCGDLILDGKSDWRFPTKTELEYIRELDGTMDINYFSYSPGMSYISNGYVDFVEFSYLYNQNFNKIAVNFLDYLLPKANAFCSAVLVRCVHN